MKRIFAIECDCTGCIDEAICEEDGLTEECPHLFELESIERFTFLEEVHARPVESVDLRSPGELAKMADRLASMKANRKKGVRNKLEAGRLP